MGKRKLKNKLFVAVVFLLAGLSALLILWPIGCMLVDTFTVLLRSWGVLPGIGQVFLKTMLLLLMVMVMVIPTAMLITLWMYEAVKGKRLLRIQRFFGGFSRCPAVLIGLMGNWLLGQYTPLHDSIWSMAILLSVMFLPFMVSGIDAALRQVPERYRLAGEALGGQRMTVFRQIILPQAAPQIRRVSFRLAERILCEATVLLTLMGTVMPNQVLATELFRLSWLGRKDAVVLAFGLMLTTILIRLYSGSINKKERGGAGCLRNWW